MQASDNLNLLRKKKTANSSNQETKGTLDKKQITPFLETF